MDRWKLRVSLLELLPKYRYTLEKHSLDFPGRVLGRSDRFLGETLIFLNFI
ncbi:hypothetical protein LEP1GSC107_2519 [Leptospira interrogans serovar Grippotyphosa str. UI 12769]|uniref:Uncharacterized protein n=2 Tax=Leptospira interrogans TaxID=173 RepID=A0A0F6HG62_LEPIR|nr:hypothetical protein [Leptospira interrogans]EKR46800.1 hypothetical protein LEP1GSC097_2909 [Leptospira interrogans serovar Grippotyphosa str. UI 08368]EMM79654.1 hypothetical protein LEP1GSC037_1408 [Leptospira interrogans str. 2006001854]EMN79483.1 hypothetical protein LEP1GSC106_2679 [Leptospira interrogans serovar Grippotyphosa str. UI 12764]EMN87096.1 hypothetical protein LEP1GSC107_2519 [Leptospira interrogans serovar Grippotyphosa str. UI 12769]EKO27369.1 hypothetical protein LEP1GS